MGFWFRCCIRFLRVLSFEWMSFELWREGAKENAEEPEVAEVSQRVLMRLERRVFELRVGRMGGGKDERDVRNV
jgi:hypothetical protein